MLTQAASIIAVLVGIIALAEWLVQRTWLRHLGVALLVIVFAALAANLNIIPAYGPETPVYAAIFKYVAPLGIFWLLLMVDLRSLTKVGTGTLTLFLVGALGTVLGVVIAHRLVGGEQAFGPLHAALSGMYTGTYVGGAVNFNAVALEYGVVEDGGLYAGAAAVDNAMTTVWMIACVALPRILSGFWPLRDASPATGSMDVPADIAIEPSSILDLAVLIALGIAVVGLSNSLAERLQDSMGFDVPSVLLITTLALVLAHLPPVRRLCGAQLLGLSAVYLFLAVIGALCDLQALIDIGELAPSLVAFVCIVVGIHGLSVFGVARVMKIDLATAAVASQANIGGGTTALALARSLRRSDLQLPAILVGSVGVVLGNYLGILVATFLGA